LRGRGTPAPPAIRPIAAVRDVAVTESSRVTVIAMEGGSLELITAAAAEGRSVSTKLLLPDPPEDAPRSPWSLRSTDLDAHGHVNNAVYWQAVERADARRRNLARPLRAELDHRDPIISMIRRDCLVQ
jgi:acyl-ACP thioesterase